MTVLANTIQNVARVGVREDLSYKIAELFPDDTASRSRQPIASEYDTRWQPYPDLHEGCGLVNDRRVDQESGPQVGNGARIDEGWARASDRHRNAGCWELRFCRCCGGRCRSV